MNKLLFTFLITSTVLLACSKKDSKQGLVNPPKETVKPEPPASVAECKQCIILSEQLQNRVAIADVESKKIIWEWMAEKSNVKPEHRKWFNAVSDAKLVYNGKYILTCSSDGAVALVRISDKKTLFYAYAGGNTHSIEMLPDGNIVSASSTGNYMTVFKVDTINFPENVYSKNISLESGHNLVWDHKNNILWSAAMNKLRTFTYNFNCDRPDFVSGQSYDLLGTNSHDLFPVYGENALWLSTGSNVYKFDITTKKSTLASNVLLQGGIKSISSGPSNFPIIVIKPKVSWWTDEVLDVRGNSVFFYSGLKIYKARWALPNAFSYPADDDIKLCD